MVVLQDTSSNGTRLHGGHILTHGKAIILSDGDVLVMGRTRKLRSRGSWLQRELNSAGWLALRLSLQTLRAQGPLQ